MTTLEGLLCEVSPLMESSLAIRSGEQLFYGESLLLVPHSNEGPSTSGRHSRHSESRRHSESHSKKGKKGHSKSQPRQDGLHNAIANAKETLRKALEDGSPAVAVPQNVMNEITALKSENVAIRKEMGELRKLFQDLQTNLKGVITPAAAPKAAEPKAAQGGDDDFDLFDSSDEEVDEEKERIKEERLAAYAAKKALKPAGIAKSSIILDVKPWDDETDMAQMEKFVRGIEKEGLVWGGGKLIPLAYGIKKLQIIVVIEDEKVSLDDLNDQITEDGADFVQSVDVVAFNKI